MKPSLILDVEKQGQIDAALFRLASTLGVSTGRLSADDLKGLFMALNAENTDAADKVQAQNPNLVASAKSLKVAKNRAFEDTMRELSDLLNLPGYLVDVTTKEMASESKKVASLTAEQASSSAHQLSEAKTTELAAANAKLADLQRIADEQLPFVKPENKTAPRIAVLAK